MGVPDLKVVQAIIGAVVGVTAVGTKLDCLDLPTLGGIVASWVTSPILAGFIGVTLHVGLKRMIINQPDADQRALRACPVLVAVTVTCMTALVLFKSPVTSHLAWWWVAAGAVVVGSSAFAGAYFLLVPHIRGRLVAASIDIRCAAWHPITQRRCFFAYCPVSAVRITEKLYSQFNAESHVLAKASAPQGASRRCALQTRFVQCLQGNRNARHGRTCSAPS